MKTTLATVFVFSLIFSVMTIWQFGDVGTVRATTSYNESSPTLPEGLKSFIEKFEADKPYLRRLMMLHDGLGYLVVPNVTILSITQNQTFQTNNITLSFTVTQPSNFSFRLNFTYSLNGFENVTMLGNTTLTGLSAGPQILVVYAENEFGDVGASEKVNFTIAEPEEPETIVEAKPFPFVILVVGVGVGVALGLSSFVVYRKKRK